MQLGAALSLPPSNPNPPVAFCSSIASAESTPRRGHAEHGNVTKSPFSSLAAAAAAGAKTPPFDARRTERKSVCPAVCPAAACVWACACVLAGARPKFNVNIRRFSFGRCRGEKGGHENATRCPRNRAAF